MIQNSNTGAELNMDSIDKAAKILFGPDGLGVSNIRFFPGLDSKYTVEERAKELVTVLSNLKSGDFKVVRKPKI